MNKISCVIEDKLFQNMIVQATRQCYVVTSHEFFLLTVEPVALDTEKTRTH